jgi:hypothetical protein
VHAFELIPEICDVFSYVVGSQLRANSLQPVLRGGIRHHLWSEFPAVRPGFTVQAPKMSDTCNHGGSSHQDWVKLVL